MTSEERKLFLQKEGIIPSDPDALMPFPQEGAGQAPGAGDEVMAPGQAYGNAASAGTGAQNAANPEKQVSIGSRIGAALGAAGRAYAREYGIDVPDPNDPRQKLKALVTPDLLAKLKRNAGMGSGEPNDQR